MGLHSVMDHLKWQTQRQTEEEREKKEEENQFKSRPRKVSVTTRVQSVTQNEKRGKTNRVGNSAVGKCIAWPYREAVSADTPLTFHTHTHNDKNSSPSGPCSVLRSPSLPHGLSATVNTSKRVCRGLSSGTFFIIC